MATGIGCSPIIFYVCYFFCHCNHGAQVQGNVLKLSDAADPSAVQHKGVTQDHKPDSLSISFVSNVLFLIKMAFFCNTAHNHQHPLKCNFKLQKKKLLNSTLLLQISHTVFSFERSLV